jgi:polyisoprenoid-binding protein YceI
VRVAVSAASRITVSGTSNVHDWKCSTSTIGAAITVRPAAGELASRVESISLKIPVKSLDCGIGQMNTNLAKAMHADKHPTIGFRMNSYSARAAGGGAYQATVNGSLTINGVTRPVTMNTTAQPNANGSVRAVGSTSFSTRTFGVEPVKALLGTIKTGENVTIQIAIVATAPPSVVAAQAAAAVKAVAKPAAKPAVKAVAAVPRAVGTVAPRAPAAVVTQAVPVVRDTVVAVVSVPAPVAPAPVRVVDSVVVQEVAGDIAVVDSAAAPEASAPVADGAVMSAADSARRFAMPAIRIQHARPRDQRGVHLFEAPKQDTVSYNGFTMQWGAAFTQEGQRLEHRNQAQPVMVAGVDQNQLMTIGGGFNNAVANLYLDVQLARGIRVALTSYLSSRHHSETWVKDGYFLIDASPIEHPLLDMLMQLATVKIGHFEVNYGDAHFRRTDNGQAMHNPLIGNLILDGFTTEIGAEGYMRLGPVLAMAGLTGGEIRGQVTGPERRSPAWLGKLGYDRNVTPELRVRLTASTYGSAKARSSTLYTGDRGGSPYFMVIENTLATETANAWSGNIRPGFANVVHAYMLNPFLKFHGLEFFGTIETATGKASAELRKRTVRQLAGEGIMRFGSHEQLYVAGRYNRVAGQLPGIAADISTNRWQAGGGWFLLPTVLAKVEYVIQRYHDFPVTDIRNGARFNGIMVAGALAF